LCPAPSGKPTSVGLSSERRARRNAPSSFGSLFLLLIAAFIVVKHGVF
jgi:hypothetical protein